MCRSLFLCTLPTYAVRSADCRVSLIIFAVNIDAGGGQAAVTKGIADMPKVDVIGQVGTGCMSKPVRRCRPELVSLRLAATFLHPAVRRRGEDLLNNPVHGAPRHRRG